MNIAYLRKSSNLQDSTHQLNAIEQYCKTNNITIDEVIKDEGISAFKHDYSVREGFNHLLDLAHNNKVHNLILFESSRLSRRHIEGLTLIEELTQLGVVIHSVSDGGVINQNELDQLLNSFRYFWNNRASKEMSKRIKSAKELLRKQNKFLGGACTWGFEVINGYEVPIEGMKATIIDFFNTYIQEGRKATSEKFNIPNRKTILNIIANPKYIAVVGQSLFDRANEIRQSRVCKRGENARSLNRSNLLFENLIFHSCGKKMNIYNDRGYGVYRCVRCKGTNVSIKKSFGAMTLEQNLEKEILSILDNLDHEELERRYNEKSNNQTHLNTLRIKEVSNYLANKEKALRMANTKLEQAILNNNDILINTISNMIQNVTNEIKDIQKELEELKSQQKHLQEQQSHQENLIQNVLQAKSIYQSATIPQKKAILNLIIDKIIVRNTDDYDIYLRL